jgi:hypothetical protein
MTPPGARSTDALPAEPLARMQSSRDIRVVVESDARVRELFWSGG